MVVDDVTLKWIRLDHTLAYLQRESCLCWLVGRPLMLFLVTLVAVATCVIYEHSGLFRPQILRFYSLADFDIALLFSHVF